MYIFLTEAQLNRHNLMLLEDQSSDSLGLLSDEEDASIVKATTQSKVQQSEMVYVSTSGLHLIRKSLQRSVWLMKVARPCSFEIFVNLT